ncbi:Uncharacterised protein [uncultured archaeon]|nr:Uncharacterised protein [uncultured archaeon]
MKSWGKHLFGPRSSDRRIDALVCELSGLTEEEIRIVEDDGFTKNIGNAGKMD